MKNILAIMEEYGLAIQEDKKKEFEKAVLENYKTVGEVEKKDEKITSLEDKITATEDALKKFEGVDADALKKQITDLQDDLANKDADYHAKLSERDFRDLLREGISSAKGKNPKAIAALLDTEALMTSKNQKEDLQAAIKVLTEAEDSKMLFGEPEAQVVGTGNVIGRVGKTNGGTEDAQMRAAMGLPPIKEGE